MKKDLLFGLSGKSAIATGVICYLLSRMIAGDSSILGITVTAMLETAGIWFFVGGVYRWNKEIKAKRLERLQNKP